MTREMTTTPLDSSQPRKRCTRRKLASRWTTLGGVLSALGICSACCLLPSLLIGLGITGAWVSALDSLAEFKWYFVLATAVLLGYGFVLAYSRTVACGAGCSGCRPGKATRVALWVGLALAVAGLLFEVTETLGD